jgi:hypothetical protein
MIQERGLYRGDFIPEEDILEVQKAFGNYLSSLEDLEQPHSVSFPTEEGTVFLDPYTGDYRGFIPHG